MPTISVLNMDDMSLLDLSSAEDESRNVPGTRQAEGHLGDVKTVKGRRHWIEEQS